MTNTVRRAALGRVAPMLVGAVILGGMSGGAAAHAQNASAASQQVGAESLAGLTREYQSDVGFLANPFMEGRGPGTRGNKIAAEFVEARFRELGLAPGISPRVWTQVRSTDTPPGEFVQGFEAGKNVRCPKLEVGDDTKLAPTCDAVALGFSGSAKLSAPLVFVGYSIQAGGPDKSYNSFAETDDLTGKIAVMLRFEPMNADGKSRWRNPSDGPWTVAAGLSAKIQETLKRGAAGVIIVNTPGADDPRVNKTETTEGTARWMREIDAPAVLIGPRWFGWLLRCVGERRSATQLRESADAAGGISPLGDKLADLEVAIERTPRTTWNVAGILPGVGELKDQYIIIGAHYDHVGYGYTGGSRSDEYGIVHPGADDNASGTAGLLLNARVLAERFKGDQRPRRSIMFVAFSAEEMGLIGSREFVKNSPVDAKNIYAMINMDMIGRLRDNALELAGTGTAAEFDQVLDPVIQSSGMNVKRSPGGRGPSDHATFYGAGIPVLHYFTGLHEEYHTPRDAVQTLNVDGAVKVAMMAATTGEALALRNGPLTFTSSSVTPRERPEPPKPGDDTAPAGPSMRNMKIRFGIAPGNYGEENQGVLVDDVFPGTSAAEAGIVKGDVLIKWSGEPIADVAGWMQQMMKHSPGDIVDVTIKRGSEEKVVRVTLKTRDQVAR